MGEAKPASKGRRDFLKIGVSALGGVVVASAVEIPLLSNQNSNLQGKLNQTQASLTKAQSDLATANQQISSLQAQISQSATPFLTLSAAEQPLVEAIVETIIPTDTDPGAKEAGVIYFIDKQLASDYGRGANMFMDGPFVPPNQKGPITVQGITYAAGTANVRVGAGTRYQYALSMREFWRVGLAAVESYANSAYGANFEKLSAANQLQALKDIWANKPTSFGGIMPQDFAYELTFMTWAGFLMDPGYGGNQGMVGWIYTGFNGVNFGNAYNEGLSQKNLMVATTPTRLKPASLAQYQKQVTGS